MYCAMCVEVFKMSFDPNPLPLEYQVARGMPKDLLNTAVTMVYPKTVNGYDF